MSRDIFDLFLRAATSKKRTLPFRSLYLNQPSSQRNLVFVYPFKIMTKLYKQKRVLILFEEVIIIFQSDVGEIIYDW